MKQIVTFILPTRNRKRFVRRAIDSCLACESDTVSPRVIVIDGESEDGTFADLQNVYGHDPRVELIENSKSAGFMNTCFQGVDLVKSKWVTFMYDDDVLSPFWGSMAAKLADTRSSFIMGYGAEFNADDVYPFKPIAEYKNYEPKQLLLAYYGRAQGIDFKGFPVSPICCITTIELLREWAGQVKSFCSRNSIRQHFMLQRNIGPDLMIYLLSMLRSASAVPLAVAVVAQFSAHPTSMSIRFGSSDLRIGYWLARIFAFRFLCQTTQWREAAICGSAIVLMGVRILIARLRRFETRWCGMILAEISGVIGSAVKNHILLRTISEGYLHILQRVRPNTRQPIPT
jgi:hypothetical protein